MELRSPFGVLRRQAVPLKSQQPSLYARQHHSAKSKSLLLVDTALLGIIVVEVQRHNLLPRGWRRKDALEMTLCITHPVSPSITWEGPSHEGKWT